MIFMIYYFIFDFFLKISLIYILESLLILLYISNIFYKFDKIFNNKPNLIYFLYILFYNLIIINYIKNTSVFFKKDLFLEKLLYLSLGSLRKIYFDF